MKSWISVVFCMILFVASGYGQAIQISATKKTADRRDSETQTLPGGRKTSLEVEQILYRFDMRPMSTSLPATGELQYVLVVEDMSGRLSVDAFGKDTIDLAFGQTRSVESKTVTLNERQWSGRHGSGDTSESIYGYGVRVVDSSGEVLAEKYSRSDIQAMLEEAFARKDTEDSRGDRVREDEFRERLQRRRALRESRKPTRP